MDGVFVGRRDELAALSTSWQRARAGTPALVLVEGPGGAGKTALTHTFVAGLDSVSALRAAGDEAETTLPFAIHDQIMDQLRGASSVFGAAATLPAADPTRDSLSEGTALLQALSRAQSIAPQVLVVDDVHLADGPSLSALTFALRRLSSVRVLTLLTVRTDAATALPPGLSRLIDSDGQRVPLRGLSTPEVQTLGHCGGFGRLSERTAARLREHTSGNPLHLCALMSDLTLAQVERLDAPLPAPRSLAMLVAATLRQTSEAAQRLAAAAAVLGSRPHLRSVARLAGLTDVLVAMEELQSVRVADLVESDCDFRFSFVHPLIRAAIYDDLKAANRAGLHRLAAAVTSGDQSLQHRVRAADAVDPDLVTTLVAAAGRHRAAGTWAAGAEALFDAYRLSEPGPARNRWLLAGVELLLLGGDLARATCYADRLAELPEDANRLQVESRMSWLAGRHVAADSLARNAWSLTGELDSLARDNAAAMLAQICLMRGQGSEAAEWADRALASGRLAPETAAGTRACRAIGLALTGRSDEGLRLLPAQPLEPAGGTSGPELGARGMLRLWTDDLSGARADLTASCVGPPGMVASGGGQYRIVFHLYLAEAEYRFGSWDAARTLAEQGSALVEDLGQTWLAAFGHALAALVPSGRGQWDEAGRHVCAAQKAAEQLGDQPSRAYADNAAVHLAACRGDAAEVVAASSWLIDTPGAHQEPGLFGWSVEHVAALIQLGRPEEAELRLVQLERVARSRGRRSQLAALARVRGELAAARHHTTAARAAFDDAARWGDGVATALESALLQASYGQFLRRRGERRAAEERLLSAHHHFTALGAQPFLLRIEQELAACGSWARARPVPIYPQLTPQEWAVAQLVCSGRTNQQVASELVLSVKTVSYHLGHVYTKIGVRSRTELVARLGTTAPSRT